MIDIKTVGFLKSKNGETAARAVVVVERSMLKGDILTEKDLARSIVIIFSQNVNNLGISDGNFNILLTN